MTTTALGLPGTAPREAASAPLTVERYVQLLYPRLAWEATVRLGDPSTAGRLVERVLHRAWRERERFAASDGLLRHATESAEAAIAREEARRLSVTRFDADEAGSGLPGDLSPLSMQAVADRLRSGRAPAATPASGVGTIAAPAQTVAEPAPTVAPVREPDTSTELPTAHEPILEAESRTAALQDTGLHPRPGRASWATPHASGPASGSSNGHTASHTASHSTSPTTEHRATSTAHRPHLRSAQYITKPSKRPSLRTIGVIAGGVLVALVGLWRLTAGPDGATAARLAAADSTAPTVTTSRGERRDTLLAEGLKVTLGPSSSVTVPAALAKGVRGVASGGVVSLDAAVDSANPLVVLIRGQRFETPGGRLSVVTSGDSVFAFAESGDVTHHAAAVTKIADGQSVLVTPAGEVSGLDRNRASQLFAWRTGRLVTDRMPARALRGPLGTWFGLDLSTDVVDTLALDVALDSVSSLPALIAASGTMTATLEGKQLTIARVASRPSTPRRAPASPVVADVEIPVLRRLPGIPEPPSP